MSRGWGRGVCYWVALACSPGCSSRGLDAGSGSADETNETGDAGAIQDPVPFEVGTRLAAWVVGPVDEPDGPVRFHGWYDRELGLDCSFDRYHLEDPRCLPDLAIVEVYTTPDCAPGTALAWIVDPDEHDCSAGLASYPHSPGDTSCGHSRPNGAVRLGAQVSISDPNGLYWLTESDGCVAKPGVFGPYCEFVEEPRETFVGAYLEFEQVGVVQRKVLHAEDGSIEQRGAFDPEIGAEIYVGSSPPELLPLGVNRIDDRLRGAADCSENVVCGTCSIGYGVDMGECDSTVYRLGPTVDSDVFAVQNDGTCAAYPYLDVDATCNSLGEALPELQAPELRVGKGRLQTLWNSHAGEPLMPPWHFYDQEIGMRCSPDYGAPDDDMPCKSLFGQNIFLTVYSDPECTVVIGASINDEDPFAPKCGIEFPVVFHYGDGTLMRADLGPDAVGPTYTIDLFNGAPCVERTTTQLLTLEPVDTPLAQVHRYLVF